MITNKQVQGILDEQSLIKQFFESIEKSASGVINLSLGNPSVKPPKQYYDALKSAIEESEKRFHNLHAYTPNAGLVEARKKVSHDVLEKFNIPVDVVMTAGATGGLNALLSVLLEEQDEVITIAPFFLEYPYHITNHQGNHVIVDSDKEFCLDISAIEKAITPRTKAMILNSPNNPTGAVYDNTSLQQLADMLKSKNSEIVIIEDAPYDNLLFNGNAPASMLSHYPHTCYVSSFSKSLGIAGERIGFIALHHTLGVDEEDRKKFLEGLTLKVKEAYVNAPALQQRAIAQLGCNITGDVKAYEVRVNKLCDVLEELDFGIQRPGGAFYVFPQIPDYFSSEEEFRQYAQKGNDPLLYLPGKLFGKYNRHIRLSASVDDETIDRACSKLRQICDKKR